MGVKERLQKFALGAIEKFAPEAEEDSYLDLKREELEGKLSRAEHGVKETPTPADEKQPFYRADGQVHSFEAVPFPGQERKLTRAQYEARYAGARPEPRRNVAWIAMAEPEPEPFVSAPDTQTSQPTTAASSYYGDGCGDGDCCYCGDEENDE